MFNIIHKTLMPKKLASMLAVMIPLLTTSCYTYKWSTATSEPMAPAPTQIVEVFQQKGGKTITLSAISPSGTYQYDAWEKDAYFAKDSLALHFDKVLIKLHDQMPQGKVVVDLDFSDHKDNHVIIPSVDLMRLVPNFNASGEHLYPELLLEEFNRFGVSFRKEFEEFKVIPCPSSEQICKDALDRVFRASVTNGCLGAGKWEFNLNSEDYSDFGNRLKDNINFNQSKIFAHSWFKVDPDLYAALIKVKNPDINIEDFNLTDFDYATLSKRSKEVTIDFDKLRAPIDKTWRTKMIETGFKSNRPIEPLDLEEHYKIEYGLFIGQDLESVKNMTYRSIVDPSIQPLKMAQFRDEGFYSPETALSFDMNWLSHLDSIAISTVDIKDTDCLVEINVTGKWCPFTVTLGNIDLAQINEQKLYGLHFGFNVYPKGRRYNPAQPTISFDEDLMPKDYERYVLMTDTKTGKWVDNFHKGLGKVYLTYPTLEKDILDIYLISYERIAPLWMGSVKLPKELREKVRIRRQLYSY